MTNPLKRIKASLDKSNITSAIASESDMFTIKEYIDSGSILFNCLLSGHPFRGFPSNKIVQFAGPESTGKTYLSHQIIKNAQDKGYNVIIFDSEFAQDIEDLQKKGVDLDRLLIIPTKSVEEFRTMVTNIVDDASEDDKIFIVIDSLGNIATKKEYTDAKTGEDKTDMTRSKILKSLFRIITVSAGIKNIPILVINHTYDGMNSFIPTQVVSGGSGSKYNSSVIITLTKAQDKSSGGVVEGVILTAKADKSRLSREKSKVKLNIKFGSGLDRFFGLVDYALEAGALSLVSGKGKRATYSCKDKTFNYNDLKKEDTWKFIFDNSSLEQYLINAFSYSSRATELKNEIAENLEDETAGDEAHIKEDTSLKDAIKNG